MEHDAVSYLPSRSDRTPIAFERSGAGLPLLLVHGSGASRLSWAPVISFLEQNCAVYAMDRRGHGASGDTEVYDIHKEFEDIATLIETLPGPVSVLAHSYGALCALGAAQLTDRVGGLALYEPPLAARAEDYCPSGLSREMGDLLERGDAEGAAVAFAEKVLRKSQEEIAAFQRVGLWINFVQSMPLIRRELGEVARCALRVEEFATSRAPTLLLLGGASEPQYRATAEALNRVLPDSRIAVLEEQQHGAIAAAPELLSQKVLEFLAELQAN